MNKYEKAFYDKLPASLSRKEKLEFMSKLGPKFEQLSPRLRQKFLRQAMDDGASQFIVKYKGKLVSVPQYNVERTLQRLGIKIQAECILLG